MKTTQRPEPTCQRVLSAAVAIAFLFGYALSLQVQARGWSSDKDISLPEEIILMRSESLPLYRNGEIIGSVLSPSGTVFKVKSVQAGKLTVRWGSGSAVIPLASTDYLNRVETMREQRQAKSAEKAIDMRIQEIFERPFANAAPISLKRQEMYERNQTHSDTRQWYEFELKLIEEGKAMLRTACYYSEKYGIMPEVQLPIALTKDEASKIEDIRSGLRSDSGVLQKRIEDRMAKAKDRFAGSTGAIKAAWRQANPVEADAQDKAEEAASVMRLRDLLQRKEIIQPWDARTDNVHDLRRVLEQKRIIDNTDSRTDNAEDLGRVLERKGVVKSHER